MEKTNYNAEKFGIGLGVAAVIAGISLILSNDYVIGTSGSIVGFGLIALNRKQIKEKQQE